MGTSTRPPPVLAGVDLSSDSAAAVDAAAAAAERHRVPLWLIGPASATPIRQPEAPLVWLPAVDADKLLAQAVDRVHARRPDLDITTTTCDGDLADTLIDRSRQATLLVVGGRHTGGYNHLSERWLGNRVVSHAHCPVLVARGAHGEEMTGSGGRPVVLGVDGSEHSAAAVPLALEEATQRGVPLRAVNVHCIDAHPTATVTDGHSYTAEMAQVESAELLAHALAGWADKYPQVSVVQRAVYAPDVACALVEMSSSADLVVVGSRGRSVAISRRLGSVSRALVDRARCPVLLTHASLA
jgi:nucleotide-binding universal stress UspA family protein